MQHLSTGWHMNHIAFSRLYVLYRRSRSWTMLLQRQADTKAFAKWFRYMLQKGYYYRHRRSSRRCSSQQHIPKEELAGCAGCCKDVLCRKVMMHLVTGGSGSGKSAYAEQQVLEAGDAPRDLYRDDDAIWRGGPPDERGNATAEMRQEKQFETIECYTGSESRCRCRRAARCCSSASRI